MTDLRRLLCLVLVCLVPPGWAAAQVVPLEGTWDPERSELFSSASEGPSKALIEALLHGGVLPKALAEAGESFTAPGLDSGGLLTGPGYRTRSLPAASEGEPVALTTWLERQRAWLADPDLDLHGKPKVVAVNHLGGDRVATEVLVDLYGPGRQVWLRWRLQWQDGDVPMLRGGEFLGANDAYGANPPFVERTAAVLAAAPYAASLLAVPAAQWATRLDDGAGTAWFGHQGLAAGDIQGDGRPDLYVPMPSGLPNLLLVQQPDGSVRDMAEEAGVAWLDDTKGALLVDLDGDGHLDLVSAMHHVLVLQRGDGQGHFAIAGGLPAPDEAPFYSIAAGDVDGDGDLDLFGTRYVRTHYGDSIPIPMEDAQNGPSNHLFLNQGEFRFVDGTRAAGLDADNHRFSLAASFADVDGDGDLDLYVANDFGPNQLWVQESRGRFRDRARELGVQDQAAGMGVSWADYDGDGDLDLYVSNMFSSAGRRIAPQTGFAPGLDDSRRSGLMRHALGNSLWRQEADGHFSDQSDAAGVRVGRWAWGALFCDWNGDGRPDLYSPNGFMTGPGQGDL
ncbi:MAG: VCBS repeat-containing protein [Planctomycetota bacterium]